jgi:rSAM/selenodomain-associated transferase 2
MARLSIVMPVLDEGEAVAGALDALAEMRGRGVEVIVVDGGSRDATVIRARMRADRVISAARGRAAQMNAGAAVASGDVLLFLHADTRLPPEADRLVLDGLAKSGRDWGRFDVAIEGKHSMLKVVAAMMNLRSRITAIATGDQAIFVKRNAFAAVGGFQDIALMEDIALSKRLKRTSRPFCIRVRAVSSGRRWDSHGLWPTILLMWQLRLAYYFGADPARLAQRYGHGRPRD